MRVRCLWRVAGADDAALQEVAAETGVPLVQLQRLRDLLYYLDDCADAPEDLAGWRAVQSALRAFKSAYGEEDDGAAQAVAPSGHYANPAPAGHVGHAPSQAAMGYATTPAAQSYANPNPAETHQPGYAPAPTQGYGGAYPPHSGSHQPGPVAGQGQGHAQGHAPVQAHAQAQGQVHAPSLGQGQAQMQGHARTHGQAYMQGHPQGHSLGHVPAQVPAQAQDPKLGHLPSPGPGLPRPETAAMQTPPSSSPAQALPFSGRREAPPSAAGGLEPIASFGATAPVKDRPAKPALPFQGDPPPSGDE